MDWKKLLSNERIKKSKTKDIRNAFESDFGRIIYSPALRRMHDKTQVFPLTNNDNIHSRLTHSNEVMSLGYTFGLKLSQSVEIQKRTNFDELKLVRILPILLQSVCFVHDIGNTPFGHFGETIIADFFKQLEKKKKSVFNKLNEHQKRDFLFFDGNAQGLRVLTKLQYLDNPYGLNLTLATLASYLKYPNFEKINKEVKGDGIESNFIEKSKHGVFFSEKEYFDLIAEQCGLIKGDRYLRHPLCYLMEASDSIAYLCMDMEDGFNKNIYNIDFIRKQFLKLNMSLGQKIVQICDDKFLNDNTKIVNIRISLISYFVDLAYENFESNLDLIEKGEYNKELIEDDKNFVYKIVKEFSNEIFKSREINYLESTGYSVITGLLKFYINFLFNKNQKYINRAKSLISKSIIQCALDENLINIGDSKKLNDEDNKKFRKLKPKFVDLLALQKRQILTNKELSELGLIKAEINKIINPCFEDLDNYSKFRIIIDFISGMTDKFAVTHFQKISGQKIS